MSDVAPRPVLLKELIDYSLDEAYRAGITADAARHDILMRRAAQANEHRARMMAAVAALCMALDRRDRESVARYIAEGVPA